MTTSRTLPERTAATVRRGMVIAYGVEGGIHGLDPATLEDRWVQTELPGVVVDHVVDGLLLETTVAGGLTIATTRSDDRTVTLRDASTGDQRWTQSLPQDLAGVRVDGDTGVAVIDIVTGEVIRTTALETEPPFLVSIVDGVIVSIDPFGQDNTLTVAGDRLVRWRPASAGGRLLLHDLTTNEVLVDIPTPARLRRVLSVDPFLLHVDRDVVQVLIDP